MTVRDYDTPAGVTERRMAVTRGDTGSGVASRQPSGPYRNFFTGQDGKHNYSLDSYEDRNYGRHRR